MWSRERDACFHRPRPLPRRVGTLPNPLLFAAGCRFVSGIWCLQFVGFICHLLAHALLCVWTSHSPFVECVWGLGGGSDYGEAADAADGAPRKMKQLPATCPGPGSVSPGLRFSEVLSSALLYFPMMVG